MAIIFMSSRKQDIPDKSDKKYKSWLDHLIGWIKSGRDPKWNCQFFDKSGQFIEVQRSQGKSEKFHCNQVMRIPTILKEIPEVWVKRFSNLVYLLTFEVSRNRSPNQHGMINPCTNFDRKEKELLQVINHMEYLYRRIIWYGLLFCIPISSQMDWESIIEEMLS